MLKYDKIVLGATLSSVLFAFYNEIPLIFVEPAKISPFDFFEPDIDLSLLKMDPIYSLQTPNDQHLIFGPPKQKVYEKILTLLSLSGLVPFSHLTKSINVEKDNLKILAQGNKIYNIAYKQIFVFDDRGINGLPHVFEQEQERITQVLDWFEVNLGSTHDIDYIETEDPFVKKIFFYTSQRDYTQSDKKDLVAVSYLTKEEATQNYLYSDTYARFRIIGYMKEAGIRGTKNGKNPNYPERSSEPFKWLSPRVSFLDREILPLPMQRYKNTKKIKFSYDTPERIINTNQIKINSYVSKLLNTLC